MWTPWRSANPSPRHLPIVMLSLKPCAVEIRNSSCKSPSSTSMAYAIPSIYELLAETTHSGSDSAPHPLVSKKVSSGHPPAGVFTQPFTVQLVLLALEEATEKGIISESDVTQEKLEGFLSGFGKKFYKLEAASEAKIVLEKKGDVIPVSVMDASSGLEVGISRSGASIFTLQWSTSG